MPELPEVETVRLALYRNVVGKTLTCILHIRRDYIRFGERNLRAFQPAILERVERKGKFLCLHLASGMALMIHLGMSGRLLLEPSTSPADHHNHVRISVDDGTWEIRQRDPRRFGFFALFLPGELERFTSWITLGPDPFELQPKRFYAIVHSSRRPIKSLLLDQKKVAGLGNIYVDESLHRCKIHPLRLADSITPMEAQRYVRIVKRVLKEAIEQGGTSTNDYRHLDGTFGAFQHWLRVYHQEGKACKTCKTKIEKIVLAGRGTHFCPNCQPLM